MQARWPREQVRIEGDATEYVRISDEGEERSSFFCPRCGATVYFWSDPERIAVPVGAFADRASRAARLGVGGAHALVSRPARGDRTHRLSYVRVSSRTRPTSRHAVGRTAAAR